MSTVSTLRKRFPSPGTEFTVKIVPESIEHLHRRVRDGQADEYYGKAIRLVVITPTKADIARWPLLKDAKRLLLAYGTRKGGV